MNAGGGAVCGELSTTGFMASGVFHESSSSEFWGGTSPKPQPGALGDSWAVSSALL